MSSGVKKSCCKEENPLIEKVNTLVKQGKVREARKLVKELVKQDFTDLPTQRR